jgi:thiamine-phosphate pyrophosphorylase
VLPAVYPIIDTEILTRKGFETLVFAEALLAGGARILQFRHKGPFDRAAALLLDAVACAVRSAGALLIVNDRADLAAVFDCGLHLGQSDLPPAMARRLLPAPHVVGFSTHNATQLSAGVAEPVDYLALGPIFTTPSKKSPEQQVGLENLRSWRLLSTKPLVAIGGITMENAPAVWRAGADSVAVISGIIPETKSPAAVRERMEQWLELAKQTP